MTGVGMRLACCVAVPSMSCQLNIRELPAGEEAAAAAAAAAAAHITRRGSAAVSATFSAAATQTAALQCPALPSAKHRTREPQVIASDGLVVYAEQRDVAGGAHLLGLVLVAVRHALQGQGPAAASHQQRQHPL